MTPRSSKVLTICWPRSRLSEFEALLADADDLHRLAFGNQRPRPLAGKPCDRRIEAAAKAAFRRGDDQEMHLVAAIAGKKLRRIVTPLESGGKIGQHRLHALGIGTGSFRRLLGATQLRRRNHLHGLGDLLRRLNRSDAVS